MPGLPGHGQCGLKGEKRFPRDGLFDARTRARGWAMREVPRPAFFATDSATVDNAGMDFGGNNLGLTPTNAQYTTGVYGQAFRFTGSDMLEVTEASPLLDCDFVTMAAWIHPVHYDVSADRGIIMNKECVHKPSRCCRFHR